MGDINNEKENARVPAKTGEKTLNLGNVPMLDLSGLTDEQIQEIKRKQADAMIDVQKKMAELGIDLQALKTKLITMAESTISLAQSADSSVTITSTSDDTTGRTEIIMGTRSDAAKKGKLTRSQTGERDYTLVWVGLAVFVIIVVMIIALAK